jgi:hypothetical protein
MRPRRGVFPLTERRTPKSVSLSPYTAAIADGMERGQFSAFVRAALLDYDERLNSGGGEHTPIEDLGLVCNAMRSPRCTICYPNGRPKREDWLMYVDAVRPLDEIGRLNESQPNDGKLEFVLRQRDAWRTLQDSIEPHQSDRVDAMLPIPENFIKTTRWGRLRAKLWPF